MKKGILSVVLIGIMAFACATCQQRAGLSDKDMAAIRQVSDQAVKMAIGPNADWGAYVSFYYTEEAKVLVPGMPILEGRAAIKAAFAAMGTILDEKWNPLSIEGHGDLAYEVGTYSYTVIPPGMSAPVTEYGKGITVWGKQTDGTWKVTHDTWNSDFPPAGLTLSTGTAKPDAGPELMRLGRLIGTWKLGGESVGSPLMPPGKVSAILDVQWFSGGSQLLCLYNMIYPTGPVQELSVYGYDPEAKAYWNYDFDSTGLNMVGKVVIQENTWTHMWDLKIEGKSVKVRLVLSDMTPDGCSWKNDYSMAAGSWTPVAEGKAIKVK